MEKSPLYFIQKGRQFNTNVKWWMITVRIARKNEILISITQTDH